MPEGHRPPRYSPTYPIESPDARLGDLIVHKKALRLFCRSCCHWSELSPSHLASKVGYDITLPEIVSRSRCSKCGGRDVSGKVTEPTVRWLRNLG